MEYVLMAALVPAFKNDRSGKSQSEHKNSGC